MASAPASCTKPECSFDQDGACAEQEDPESCRYRGRRPLIIDDGGDGDGDEDYAARLEVPGRADTAEDDGPIGSQIELASGERLDFGQCALVLAEAPGRIVSFVAPKDAGKTSLIAGLYELFLENRQGSLLFRGSRTVLGFERLCHLSRAASGRIRADMERTRRAEGLGYFHLDLVAPAGRVGLLLGDRPGEQFVSAAQSLDQVKSLGEIAAATTLAYLIDGRVLGNPKTKGVPASVATSILDAIVEARLAPSRPALAVVLTKADLLEGDAHDAHIARFEAIVAFLSERYSEHFSTVKGFQTAASPDPSTEACPRGVGLAALLEDLLLDPRTVYAPRRTPSPPSRYFERLGTLKVDAV